MHLDPLLGRPISVDSRFVGDVINVVSSLFLGTLNVISLTLDATLVAVLGLALEQSTFTLLSELLERLTVDAFSLGQVLEVLKLRDPLSLVDLVEVFPLFWGHHRHHLGDLVLLFRHNFGCI